MGLTHGLGRKMAIFLGFFWQYRRGKCVVCVVHKKCMLWLKFILGFTHYYT